MGRPDHAERGDRHTTAPTARIFCRSVAPDFLAAYPDNATTARLEAGNAPGAKERNLTKMADSIWPAGSALQPLNVAWTSGNGRAILRLQEDRNLVLYKDNQAAYAAPNAWSRGNAAVMQDDGNFVLYDQNGEPVWASNTGGNPGAYLAVQDDGNMVVYQDGSPLWASNTGD